MNTLTLSLIGYLVSSIPFGYIIFFILKKDDIRKYGSGNIGATNVLRNAGKLAGILTAILDISKALIPILVSLHYLPKEKALFVWLATVLGHIFPIYLKFKGGKGVSTAVGGALIIDWRVFILFILLFLITIFLSRMVSLSSLVGSITLPVGFFYFYKKPLFLLIPLLITILIYIRHISNIKRIIAGNERKI